MADIKFTLQGYLACKGITVKEFATSLGYTPQHISSVANQTRPCGSGLSKIILKATDGLVYIEPKKKNKKQSLHLQEN